MTPATTAPWRIEVGFLTDTGLARTRNEDAYALYLPYEGEANHSSVDAVFAVADGLGGHAAGDVASRFAADAVVLAFTEADAGVPGQNRQLESWIEELLRQINHELYELAHSDPAHHGMGSTLTLAALRGSSLILGHVGDTRCYRLREGELTQLTEDHSWVAEQRRAGLISAEEEERHPDRNVLTECLGTEQLSRVFTLETTVREGDRFLLCSDGLHGQVSASVLAGVLGEEREPQAAVRRLVEMANHSGGPDNITAVVFELHPAAEPVGEPAEPAPPETGADQHERRSPLADTLPDGLRPTPRRPSRRRVLMAVSAADASTTAHPDRTRCSSRPKRLPSRAPASTPERAPGRTPLPFRIRARVSAGRTRPRQASRRRTCSSPYRTPRS